MTREQAVQIIENMPISHECREFFNLALDALRQPDIVRCKDCQHWDYRTEGCMHLTGRIAPVVKTGADWFCADAKRR